MPFYLKKAGTIFSTFYSETLKFKIMFSRVFIKSKKETNLDVGSVLLAQPFWQDEKYRRSVIMLLEHNSEGSKGIILNKASTLTVNEALPELETGLPLYYGGPFKPEIISFIHNYPSLPETFGIGNEMFFDGNYEYLLEMFRNKNINLRKIRFYSGFVLWTPGQLESEIQESKWWTSEMTAQEFFTTSPEELWTYELLNNGHLYGLLNEFPDPGMN
jgi:putative transcriptional regulator